MLRALTTDIWEVLDDLYLPGGLHFPIRMTVVRLRDGGLWLHSPVALDAARAALLDELGPVRDIVAPSKLHHLHLQAAASRYPDATVWAAPGLREKIPGLPDGPTLGVDEPDWRAELAPFPLAGLPWMNEVMFLHHPTRTALATDLFFHIRAPANWQNRLLFRLLGVLGRPQQSPVLRLRTRDRAAARASLRRLLDERPARFVVAHGPPITEEVQSQVERACAWMLAGGDERRISTTAGRPSPPERSASSESTESSN